MTPIEAPLLKEGQESGLILGCPTCFAQTYHAVPVYDGHEKFKLNSFCDKPYKETIKDGSTVMVLFSVKKGSLGKKAQTAEDLPGDVTFVLYLNILSIICTVKFV